MFKRFLCFLFVLLMIVSTACSSLEPVTKTQEVKTEPTEEKSLYPKVTNPLTWDRIRALPIATDAMTEEERRQLCVDFMRLQLTFEWTPAEPIEYILGVREKDMAFHVGHVYGGPPYRSGNANGNLYLWMEYLDPETNTLSLGNYKAHDLMGILGNDCASSPFWAWNRVINSNRNYKDFETESGVTNIGLTPENNLLPVGGYTSISSGTWDDGLGTRAICENEGVQGMYRVYTAMKPADGMIHFYPGNGVGGNANHLMMVSSYPTVVYEEDGVTIDGEKSFVTILDQRSNLTTVLTDHGNVSYEGGVDAKFSFAQLYKEYYIPFTFKEFLGTDPIEKGEATLHVEGDAFDYETLRGGEIKTNYAISHVTIRFFDEKGKTRYQYMARPVLLNTRSLSMSHVLIASTSFYADGKTPFELTVQIGNGESFTLLEGTLSK